MTTKRAGDYFMGSWWFVAIVLLVSALWYHSQTSLVIGVFVSLCGAGIELERS